MALLIFASALQAQAPRFARVELRVTVDNLFNVTWNEAQFDTRSRLPGEPAAGVDELHFTPGAPRIVQVALGYRL